MRPLSRVEAAFDIAGRGCFLKLSSNWWSEDRVKRGDPIQLRTPDGQILDTHIYSIEIACGTEGASAAIGLPANFSKMDVPIGTEVWVTTGKE